MLQATGGEAQWTFQGALRLSHTTTLADVKMPLTSRLLTVPKIFEEVSYTGQNTNNNTENLYKVHQRGFVADPQALTYFVFE